MSRLALLGPLVLVVAATGACDKRKPEAGGVGPWRFSIAKRSNVKSGRCDPHPHEDGRVLTWCYGGAAYEIAGRPAELALYFNGPPDKMDAPLVEIQLEIRGCNELELDRWLRKTYGNPVETKGTVSFFQNSFLWVSAQMPSTPGRCRVRVLPLSEGPEIQRVKQKTLSETGSAAG